MQIFMYLRLISIKFRSLFTVILSQTALIGELMGMIEGHIEIQSFFLSLNEKIISKPVIQYIFLM